MISDALIQYADVVRELFVAGGVVLFAPLEIGMKNAQNHGGDSVLSMLCFWIRTLALFNPTWAYGIHIVVHQIHMKPQFDGLGQIGKIQLADLFDVRRVVRPSANSLGGGRICSSDNDFVTRVEGNVFSWAYSVSPRK